MAEIIKSGITAIWMRGVKSHMDKDINYQRVPVEEMGVSSSEDDLEPEKYKRDHNSASPCLTHHLRAFRQKNSLWIYTMIFGGTALLLFLYWAVV
jgi:hypothetical protein